MLLFGLPIALQYVVITTGGMILQSSVNLQGSLFIAGYTATNKLYSFLQCFAMSFGVSACTFLAQNYGAGLYDRFKQGVADAVKIVSVTAFVITGIALLTLEIAVRYLTLMAPCFVIVHILHVFRNVLQAMGVAVWALASGIAEFAARVFMSRIAINWIGADALFIAEPASWLGAMLCVFLPYFYYRKKYLEYCP